MAFATTSTIKTFQDKVEWTIANFKLFTETFKSSESFIQSIEQTLTPHFKYRLRMEIGSNGGEPFVELHIKSLREIKTDLSYRIALVDSTGKEIDYCTTDWTTKKLKSNSANGVSIFPGPDILLDKLSQHNHDVFESGKLKFICEVNQF